jgi:hypothetical protein
VEGASQRKIERLIEDLGSDRFEIREAATHTLREMDEATCALYKARRSPDPEVRQRVEGILLALERKRALRGLARAKALGKAGRAVEAADRLAKWGKWDATGAGWESLTQFADRAIVNTARYFPPVGSFRQNPNFPAGEFRRFANLVHPKDISERKIDIDIGDEPPRNQKEREGRLLIKETGGRLLLRGEEVSLRGRIIPFGLSTGIVAASGDVQLMSAFDSVIVTGGDVKNITLLRRCILVCDGDVELLEPPTANSLIIARGKVTCLRGKLTKCMVRSGRSLRFLDGKTIDLKDDTPDPLAFVKFFELSDVGLTVSDRDQKEEPIQDGVLLKDVGKDSPFASGLRAGDMVTALDETKIASREVFRRHLRRKLGGGGPILTFTVRRSGKSLEVPIPIKD